MLSIFMVAILASYLYDDYKKDKGLHKKAKIIHAIFLVVIVFSYSDLIRYLGRLIRKSEETIAVMSEPIGMISGEMHLTINLIKIVAGICLVFFCLRMGQRKEWGKTWAMRLLPVVAVAEIVSFYGGWTEEADTAMYHWTGLAVGFILLGGICTLVIVTYSKEYMKDFFERKDPQKEAIENFGSEV